MHQVVALKKDFPEVLALSKAFVRFYPNNVEAVREYLLGQEGIKGTESARLIEQSLILK
ncbi:hypothetical protein D3C78_1898320 [compost metagenome]